MTPEEYSKWSKRHAAMFGLEREQNADTFAAWADVFRAANYTADELREATDWLAANEPPKYRSEHLAAIQQRVRSRRYDRQAEVAKEEVSFPHCDLCGGSGWASVPELRCIHNGEWDGTQTRAVLCWCSWGQREKGRHNGKRPPQTLGSYQHHNPGWLDQLERHKELQAAQVRARQTTEAADKLLGPVLARVRRLQAGQPPLLPMTDRHETEREPGIEDEDEEDGFINF